MEHTPTSYSFPDFRAICRAPVSDEPELADRFFTGASLPISAVIATNETIMELFKSQVFYSDLQRELVNHFLLIDTKKNKALSKFIIPTNATISVDAKLHILDWGISNLTKYNN